MEGKPKVPMKAYHLYYRKCADSDKPIEFKKAAEAYRALSDTEKEPFEREREQLKNAYAIEMGAYKNKLSAVFIDRHCFDESNGMNRTITYASNDETEVAPETSEKQIKTETKKPADDNAMKNGKKRKQKEIERKSQKKIKSEKIPEPEKVPL